jgi:endonuclease/exonuclease/phosphatase (EEP) superfamily protein YafD
VRRFECDSEQRRPIFLRQRLSDAWRERGSGFGMAAGADWPLRSIDYVLVSGLDIGDIRVLDQTLSDHRAITATF